MNRAPSENCSTLEGCGIRGRSKTKSSLISPPPPEGGGGGGDKMKKQVGGGRQTGEGEKGDIKRRGSLLRKEEGKGRRYLIRKTGGGS